MWEEECMLKKKIDWKEWGIDLLVDLVAGMLGAVGIYNFALNANFPGSGIFHGSASYCIICLRFQLVQE